MKLSDKVEITVGELVSYIYAIADELSSEYGTQYSNEKNGIRRMQKKVSDKLRQLLPKGLSGCIWML